MPLKLKACHTLDRSQVPTFIVETVPALGQDCRGPWTVATINMDPFDLSSVRQPFTQIMTEVWLYPTSIKCHCILGQHTNIAHM